MDLIWKIRECKTMNELDHLRQEIAVAGMYGEIPDFGFLKREFLKKKEALGAKK
ncbi:hypothetical protein HU147_18590 [Planomicrobium chinense]|uniref:hypothetical protein n=1 Tax=Planococcus chinensis TaxID=272917 RepID=UPI001CC53097|nr:hypothetical protein [Planococcus chinensis]MBZ5203215.1 hypothetical protein [Planococcus chinensis]